MLRRHPSSRAMALTLLLIIFALPFVPSLAPTSARAIGGKLRCEASSVRVVDGDTIRACGERVRLAAIDAPELPGHCNHGRTCTPGDGWASKANLARLIGSGAVELRVMDRDRYGRLLACVSAAGRDLSHAQAAGGFAVERYRPLSDCR
jgi:micrococcal nuclease